MKFFLAETFIIVIALGLYLAVLTNGASVNTGDAVMNGAVAAGFAAILFVILAAYFCKEGARRYTLLAGCLLLCFGLAFAAAPANSVAGRTEIYKAGDPSHFITDYIRKHPESGIAHESNGGGSGSNGTVADRQFSISFEAPTPEAAMAMLTEFRAYLISTLNAEGMRITGSGWSGLSQAQLRAFNLDYQRAGLIGTFQLQSSEVGKNRHQWSGMMLEVNTVRITLFPGEQPRVEQVEKK